MKAKYRKAIYVVAIGIAAASFAAGWVTPDEVEAAVDSVARIVAVIASVLALLNITPDGEGGASEG